MKFITQMQMKHMVMSLLCMIKPPTQYFKTDGKQAIFMKTTLYWIIHPLHLGEKLHKYISVHKSKADLVQYSAALYWLEQY